MRTAIPGIDSIYGKRVTVEVAAKALDEWSDAVQKSWTGQKAKITELVQSKGRDPYDDRTRALIGVASTALMTRDLVSNMAQVMSDAANLLMNAAYTEFGPDAVLELEAVQTVDPAQTSTLQELRVSVGGRWIGTMRRHMPLGDAEDNVSTPFGFEIEFAPARSRRPNQATA